MRRHSEDLQSLAEVRSGSEACLKLQGAWRCICKAADSSVEGGKAVGGEKQTSRQKGDKQKNLGRADKQTDGRTDRRSGRDAARPVDRKTDRQAEKQSGGQLRFRFRQRQFEVRDCLVGSVELGRCRGRN